MAKAVSCGFIVFARETGTVLACHPNGQAAGPEMAYDIPKGHLEEGEQPLEAAKRELKEETGLVLPPDAPLHEIGLVPYQKQKSLHLFSTSLPAHGLAPGKLRCDSTFVDTYGHTKKEIDSYMLTANANCFFKNLQPYVKQEIARATLSEPLCMVRGTVDETGKEIRMKLRENGLMARTYRDLLVTLKDGNVYPNGYSADVELEDGTIVSVDMDELQADLVGNFVAVDVDGSIANLPEFPIDQWFEQAMNTPDY